jgi:hypothetical protein
MNLLRIEIKEKEILMVEIEDNYRPYAFVVALYVIMVTMIYYTTWMYTATMNREIEDLTMLLVVVCIAIYISNRK